MFNLLPSLSTEKGKIHSTKEYIVHNILHRMRLIDVQNFTQLIYVKR